VEHRALINRQPESIGEVLDQPARRLSNAGLDLLDCGEGTPGAGSKLNLRQI
jgi:hypothetical protein